MFSTLVVIIAFAPAFFTSQETTQQNLYTAIGALIQSTVVLILIFVAKLYALYYVKEEDQQLVTHVSGSIFLNRSTTKDSAIQERSETVGTISEHVNDKNPNKCGSYNKTFSEFGSQTIEAEFLCNYQSKNITTSALSVANHNCKHNVNDEFEIDIKDDNTDMYVYEKEVDIAETTN